MQRSMFYGASAFRHVYSKWDVQKATGMTLIIKGTIAFSVDPSKWDLARITGTSSTFYGVAAMLLKLWRISFLLK